MKATPYIIEIDAQTAFKHIGVDLKISPFPAECTEALKQLLVECITPQLLTSALVAAAGGKRKCRRKSSADATPSKPQTGGQGHDREKE